MDEASAFVGEWSPSVRLEAATPHGISQSGLALRAGRAYTGRVALAGSPGAKVSVTLVWGPNPGDRQTIPVPALTARYARVPAEVHTEGRHDRRPVRDRRDRHGQLPHRRRVPDAGRQRLGLQGRDHPLPEGARDRDRALAGRELRFRLRLARRARRPRQASAAARARLERHGVERHGRRRLHDLLSAHRRHTVPRRQLRPRRRPLGGRGGGVRQRPRHQPSRSAARGERPPGSLRGEDLGRRQRDVRALAVGPHAHHAVRGEAQPDGRGHAQGRPDPRGDRLRRDARGGLLVLHREPAARHLRGTGDGERAAAVRLRLEPGLDGGAAEDLRRSHRLPRRALLRLPQPGDRPGHAAVRPLRRAHGAQGPALVEPGAVQVRGVGRVPEAVPLA